MNPIPSTPTVAIARELRRLGLKQGAMGDFTVAGHYVRKERRFSYVTVTSKEAERLLVEHADEIEERTANGPFPFKVSVRYVGDIPFIDIHNGPAERVRELPESARRAAAEQPAEAAEQAPEAIEATEATEATETDAPAAEQAPDPLAVPAGLYVVPRMSTRLHDWYGLECGRCTPGVRQELPGEWDNRADAARAAQDHYEFTHRPADDVLSLEELEELERWPLSAAQYQVLSYARHGQLQEFADGFWALDVNPCKFDVNKKVAAARVTRMWTAGLLGVRADGPGARLFVLTKTGRRVADLLWRAQRQGLRTEVPAKDAALAPEPGRPTSYPTLAEGRYFVGEERPQAPAAEETQAPEEAPAEPAPVAEEAPAAPAMDWRDEQAAKALGWSTKHAAAVRAAVDGHLVRDEDGTPRLVTRPGLGGTPIAAGRLVPLEAAGYLVHGDPDEHGRRPILPTADARRALALWDHFQPTPAERGRKQEHLPLAPLQGGEEHQRRAAKFAAEQAQREVERERFYAELAERHAAEELEDRCWDAWARVQDITHRLGRKVPAGWAPTDEEVDLHRLDPEIVALLRQRAAAHAAEQAPAEAQAPAAVDGPQQAEQAPEQGELWNGRPGPLPGPGVVEPGMHVEYLPGFRPGARTRHCHGGVIVSVGTTCVRWRPYKWHQDVRTPLDHMRIDPTMHVNQREWVRRMAADLDAGRPLTRHPEWTVWSLAQHLAHAAEQDEQAAVEETPAAPPARVVVIPCGGAKQAQAAPAGELYTGGYHRACRRAADALTAQGGTTLVLSALHGLVTLDQVLEPYDLRMGQPGSVTPARLAEQARALGLDRATDVTVLGGAAYTAAALTVWPQAATPLAGLGGMGYQLQALAAIAAGAAPAAPATPPTPECNLTLQYRVAFMVTTGRAQGPNREGASSRDHHPDRDHRGRRGRHRRPGHPHHRRGQPARPQPGGGGRAHDRRRHPGRNPPQLRDQHRPGPERHGRLHPHRPVPGRPLLQ
ncbi:DUF6884 domain-containing protein [Streptomyces chartreusis]|uniref:DUF6884 domain-containing protein n=1 Tax=Streptomyces chartreusis TaxID=1969 RepID=UPI002E174221|nr:DUF6884 domain-containing protein [Streptomyces chartreusis]